MKLPDALEQAVRTLLSTNGTHDAPLGVKTLPERVEISLHGEPDAPPVTPSLEPEQAEASAELPVSASDAQLGELEQAAALVEKLGLGYHLGSAVERIALAADEGSEGTRRLREATWLIERYCELLEQRPIGADLHVAMMRLTREGDAIAGLQALAGALERAPTVSAGTAVEAQPVIEQRPQPESTVVFTQPSVWRALFIVIVRAVVLVAAIVGIVLALTLIAQLH